MSTTVTASSRSSGGRSSKHRHRSLVAVLALVGVAACSQEVRASPPPEYYGVNLASGSFGPSKLPGVAGKDYIYPTREVAEPFRQMGMNTIRLPILWERLQREPFAPLDEGELGRLDQTLGDLDGFKSVIIDLHNYGRYRGAALDQSDRSGAMLADFWTRLAEHYKGNSRVAFGVMNEPHDMDSSAWRRIADGAVDAIRRTGARNLVLVPGNRWSGGHSWHAGGSQSNAAALSGFVDPGRNFVFEIHQYLDSDSSGTKKDCSGGKNAGRQRLAGVTRWLREENAKAVLAEFGTPSTPTCLAALDDMLQYLRENGDVWVGWTYWAGGDWWGDDPYSIQPQDGRAKPQTEVLRRHINSYRQSASR